MKRRQDGKPCAVVDLSFDEVKVEEAFIALLMFLRDGVCDPAVVHVGEKSAWTAA